MSASEKARFLKHFQARSSEIRRGREIMLEIKTKPARKLIKRSLVSVIK